MFGGLLRKLQLADINLAVSGTIATPSPQVYVVGEILVDLILVV